MQLPIVETARSDCTRCELHGGALNVGIGGRKFIDNQARPGTVVVFVGQSPGYQEDQKGRAFVGPSGLVLQWYCKQLEQAGSVSDVWVINAVKCVPPPKSDVKPKHLSACLSYLASDMDALLAAYPNHRVVFVCLGAPAARAVLGDKSLAQAAKRQGDRVSAIGFGKKKHPLAREAEVFVTYHPAFLLRKRTVSTERIISDHLRIVIASDSLIPEFRLRQKDLDESSMRALLDEVGVPAETMALCIDIETYGIRAGRKQTVFHPVLSREVDGVPVANQIVSCAFTLGSIESNTPVDSSALLWYDDGPNRFLRVLKAAKSLGIRWLAFTNGLFDLAYLIASVPSAWWDIQHFGILDVCVFGWMDNPENPSLSLKDLGPMLLGPEARYDREKGRQYSVEQNEDLLRYNVKDTYLPIGIMRVVLRRIRSRGYPSNPWAALRSYSLTMRVLLHMTMSGMSICDYKLGRLTKKLDARIAKMLSLQGRRGIVLKGQGSQISWRSLIEEAEAFAKSENLPAAWERSKETSTISTGKVNLRTVLSLPNAPFALRRKARLLLKFRKLQKLLSSYLHPIGSLMHGRRVYPRFFPVPSRFDAGVDSRLDVSGGTRQVRVTCKMPALQTLPGKLEFLYSSRYRHGTLMSFDYSQLELRMFALVCGDDGMIQVFRDDRDLHEETLFQVAGRRVAKSDPHYKEERRKAKYTNFGVIYGISPRGLSDAWWRFMAVRETESVAQVFISAFFTRFPKAGEFHEAMHQRVVDKGFIELPVTGHWLPFTDPRDIEDKAYLNFPIQGPSAFLTIAAQREIQDWLASRGYGCSPLNVFDSIFVDIREPEMVAEVRQKCVEIMTRNWYLDALSRYYGRSCPITVDAKILDERR